MEKGIISYDISSLSWKNGFVEKIRMLFLLFFYIITINRSKQKPYVQRKGSLRMYQVIIVDDEAKIRNGIAGLFPWSQLGFEIAGCFSNGKAAYEYTLANHVDLVLSDIRMPIMDGLELSEKLLEKRDIKIIFFSGYQDFEYVRRALRTGVVDYLLKPVKYEDLVDCLTRIRDRLNSETHAAPPGRKRI